MLMMTSLVMLMVRGTRWFAGAGLVLGALVLSAVRGGGVSSDAAPNLPTERLRISDLDYLGAFRLSSDTFGVSNTNYAAGTLGYNPTNHSLFIAGHAQHNAVAEFAIPLRARHGQRGSLLMPQISAETRAAISNWAVEYTPGDTCRRFHRRGDRHSAVRC